MSDKKVVTVGEWADALRSGKYKQTRGALRRDGALGGMCCLGVLCDLVDPEQWETGAADAIGASTAWNGWTSLPPDELGDQISVLFHITDDFTGDHESVATYNDNSLGFDQIADVIESNYPRTREIVWSEDRAVVKLAAVEAQIADLGAYAPAADVRDFQVLKATASIRPLNEAEISTLDRTEDNLRMAFGIRRMNTNQEEK